MYLEGNLRTRTDSHKALQWPHSERFFSHYCTLPFLKTKWWLPIHTHRYLWNLFHNLVTFLGISVRGYSQV